MDTKGENMNECHNCGCEFSDAPGFLVDPAVPFCGTYCEQDWWQDPFAGAMYQALMESYGKAQS